MVQAQIKVDELNLLIDHQGLKNLDGFAVRATINRIKKDFEALIQSDATEAYHNLGILHAYQTNYELALSYFRKALALAPNDVVILLNYAKVLEIMGLYQEMINSCTKALQLEPLNLLAFGRLNKLSDLYLLPDGVEQSFILYKGEPIVDKSKKVENSLSTIHFLNSIKVKLETYRTHLNLTLRVYQQFFNLHKLNTSTVQNIEGSYLSTVILVPNASAKEISLLNQALDEKVMSWLYSQPDGGFDLADELEGSVIYFSTEIQN
jgi:tetratricopeptide (TPR) repeat protein